MQQALEDKLKYLRMSAIQRTLDARNKYAIENKITYMEFLEQLIEDECAIDSNSIIRALSIDRRRGSVDYPSLRTGKNHSCLPYADRHTTMNASLIILHASWL